MNSNTILSAHQPHYLPWLPYCCKIAKSDHFVLADDVQYKTNNFINRTRIKNTRGAQWLTVPVLTKGKRSQLIKEVKIVNERNWRRIHRQSIFVNYKHAPFFDHYFHLFDQLYQKSWTYLLDLNVATIELLQHCLHLSTPSVLSSDLSHSKDRNQRIIDMVTELNCNIYLSGPSGKKYLDQVQFKNAGINIFFSDYKQQTYRQQFGEFIPNLSALDLLFNEGDKALTILKNGAASAAKISSVG